MIPGETMIFSNKRDAQNVHKFLGHYSIISVLNGREVTAMVPHNMTPEFLRETMIKLVSA